MGIEKNEKEAIKWYKKASDRYYQLAESIFTINQDVFRESDLKRKKAIKKLLNTDEGKEMMMYYRQAAKLGHKYAKKRLEELYRFL